MKDAKESKAEIELGGTKTVEGFEFYIGFCSLIYEDEINGEKTTLFGHIYQAFSPNFAERIYLAGFDSKPVGVRCYHDVCIKFAVVVAEEMKEYGIRTYELVNGNNDTGIVFDTRINQFAYYSNAGAKMDPVPEDGIKMFKETLEACLQG